MDFELTPDQELFIASAKEYAEKYFTPEAIKQAYEVDHHGFPRVGLHASWPS